MTASAAAGDEQVSVLVPVRGFRKVVFLLAAAVFFALATAGVVLPGLPTTPFLLLTSYFLVRSSPGLNARLLRSRFFGPILADWQLRGGIRRDIRIKAVSAVLLAVAASLYFAALTTPGKVVVCFFACIGVTVVLRLPAARAAENSNV